MGILGKIKTKKKKKNLGKKKINRKAGE